MLTHGALAYKILEHNFIISVYSGLWLNCKSLAKFLSGSARSLSNVIDESHRSYITTQILQRNPST